MPEQLDSLLLLATSYNPHAANADAPDGDRDGFGDGGREGFEGYIIDPNCCCRICLKFDSYAGGTCVIDGVSWLGEVVVRNGKSSRVNHRRA